MAALEAALEAAQQAKASEKEANRLIGVQIVRYYKIVATNPADQLQFKEYVVLPNEDIIHAEDVVPPLADPSKTFGIGQIDHGEAVSSGADDEGEQEIVPPTDGDWQAN